MLLFTPEKIKELSRLFSRAYDHDKLGVLLPAIEEMVDAKIAEATGSTARAPKTKTKADAKPEPDPVALEPADSTSSSTELSDASDDAAG